MTLSFLKIHLFSFYELVTNTKLIVQVHTFIDSVNDSTCLSGSQLEVERLFHNGCLKLYDI